MKRRPSRVRQGRQVLSGRRRRLPESAASPRPDHIRRSTAWLSSHLLGHELRERAGVALGARGFESAEVFGALLDSDDGPWVPTSGEQRVHKEAGDAAISVGERMYVAKEPVRQHGAYGGVPVVLRE